MIAKRPVLWLAFPPPGLDLVFERARKAPSSPAIVSAPRPDPAVAETSARVQSLERELAREREARKDAESTASTLRSQLAPFQKDVVVSFGKVEDVGHQAALLFANAAELERFSKRDPASLSADEHRRLLERQRQRAAAMGIGMLPEIADFQNHPAGYGRFFRSMLQQSAGLTDPRATPVEAYMPQRTRAMAATNLNAAKTNRRILPKRINGKRNSTI